jgi:toxin FitB
MFFGRILQVTEDIKLGWRVVVEAGRKEGHTFSQPDLIIAVTAMHHGLTMVTRDRSDFERAGATVVNPWDAT